MIVRQAGHLLHLISQPDHAALARRIMQRWAPLHDAERRASILLAIEEHDNGWREPDASPSVDASTGAVFDFIHVPAPVRQAVWPRGVNRLAHDDPWAAALVAHHAVTVYDRYRSDAEWRDFFPQMERLRDDLVTTTRRTAAQLRHDYAFVRIGDLISLIFCTRWDEAQTYDTWTFTRDGDRVLVSPDAFGGQQVPIAVPAREIPARRYTGDEDLQRVIRTSPVVTLSGEVAASAAV
jgi:hypothetical protein